MIILKGQSLPKWKEWLKKELEENGRENQVFGPEGKKVYKFLIEAFLEAINSLEEREEERERR